jgi:hypothetical protein
MASRAYISVVLWSVLAAADIANVVTYSPRVLDPESKEFGNDVDLLLLVEQKKSLGKSPFDTALKSLAEGHAGLTRNRGLLVSRCSGCESLHQLLQRYRIDPAELPLALLFPRRSDDTKQGKFRLDLQGVGQALPRMTGFIRSFDSGDLKPWIRSASRPTADQRGAAVQEVVGSTFEKDVLDSNQHILLLLYSPTDSASKLWQPIFEQLGQTLDPKRASFRIARLNGVLNEVPPTVNIDVNSFPQVYLFRDDDKGDPDVFPQEDGCTMGNMLSWLGEMLPQQNYGLDSMIASFAETQKVAWVRKLSQSKDVLDADDESVSDDDPMPDESDTDFKSSLQKNMRTPEI